MPRCLLGVFILLLVSVSVVRAQGDAVLLSIGPLEVSRNEFAYHYNCSPEEDKHVFLQTFIDYKFRILQARELGLDTLPDYLAWKKHFQQHWEELGSLKKRAERKNGKEWMRLVHYTYPLRQQASREEELKAKQFVDSLAVTLKEGTGLDEIGEEIPWIQTRYLLDEWQKQLVKLKKDQVSLPFYSPLGIHLIAWKEKKWAMDVSGKEDFLSKDEELRRRVMDEAFLMSVWAMKEAEPLVFSQAELESYFEKHRVTYGWGTPHYKGAVIHCKNKKEAKAIRKYLKKYPEALWNEAIERVPAEISENCRIEVGLFPIGKNAYIDKLVFKCGSYEPLPDCPYTWVMGKKMKKGPGSYQEVSQEVEKDYRKEVVRAQFDEFKQKYGVEIDEEVLKTVNRSGN